MHDEINVWNLKFWARAYIGDNRPNMVQILSKHHSIINQEEEEIKK